MDMWMMLALIAMLSAGAPAAQTGAPPPAILLEAWLATASDDEYSPAAHGRLTQEQIDSFVRHTDIARTLMAKYERWSYDNRLGSAHGDGLNYARLPLAWHRHRGLEVHSGMRDIDLRGNARLLASIQAVKSSGGNWAEHQWVRARLRQIHATDAIRKDVQRDPSGTHNLALYRANKSRIAAALMWFNDYGHRRR